MATKKTNLLTSEIATIPQMADLLGLSRGVLDAMARKGIVVSAGKRGKYDLPKSLKNIVKELRERALSDKDKLSDDEKKLLRTKRKRAELAYQIEAGQAVMLADVEEGLASVSESLAYRTQNIGAKLAPQLAGLSRSDIADTIQREIDDLIRDMEAKYETVKSQA